MQATDCGFPTSNRATSRRQVTAVIITQVARLPSYHLTVTTLDPCLDLRYVRGYGDTSPVLTCSEVPGTYSYHKLSCHFFLRFTVFLLKIFEVLILDCAGTLINRVRRLTKHGQLGEEHRVHVDYCMVGQWFSTEAQQHTAPFVLDASQRYLTTAERG